MEQEGSDELWTKATALHLENKFEEAEKIYTMLLEQNPLNTDLMATLGSLYVQTERPGLAIHFLESTIDKGFKQPDIYTNLGLAYKMTGQQQKAKDKFEVSITINPTPEALTNYSACYVEAGEDEKCIDLCERAIKMRNDLPVAHWNMSIALLANGKWERGWDSYDWGIKWPGLREDRKLVDLPWWDGTPGKTVLVYGEQGIGDEIMFASMLPDIMKTHDVVFECFSRLETLFRNSFPSIPIHGTRTVPTDQVDWHKDMQFDYRMCLGSLGRFYRRSIESFPGIPYLKAEPLPKTDKLRVGISWTGGKKQGRVVKRAVPLPWWKSILNVPNVEFVSLQYTDAEAEIQCMEGLGYEIRQMDEHIKALDFNETAKVVASCDLVISCCTSVIHLAGALGVPCWCMTPRWPAWRYQNSGKMPWYRSVRLYRCSETGQDAWLPVIARVGADLDDFASRWYSERMVA